MPQQTSQRWKSLFDSSPSAMVIADLDRNVIDANRSFSRMFGYELSEVKALQVPTLYAEYADFERCRDAVLHAPNASGAKFYTTYRRKDDTVFPGHASLMLLKDDDDRSIGVAGIINDLSETVGDDLERLLEVERHKAEDTRQKALYFRSPAMMHSINETGCIETVSNAWLQRFGYLEEEVLGKRSADFLTPECRAYAAEVVLPEFWKTGACEKVPYTFVCKDGALVEIELSAVLDRSQGKQLTLAVLDDVTERNTSRRALEQRNQDLHDFAHIAAHDLQAPIRHISLCADMMREDIKTGTLGALEEHLGVIENRARALSVLIRSLLDFSVTSGAALDLKMNDTDLMIENAKKMLTSEIADSNATVEASALPPMNCDRSLMLRVLTNLISNSLKYVETGVTPFVRITGYSKNGETVLRISDNGVGIPEAFRERVFQPLKRLHGTDSKYAGTGIGLALCKRIVEAHRGTIRVGDAGPTGAVFEVKLPN